MIATTDTTNTAGIFKHDGFVVSKIADYVFVVSENPGVVGGDWIKGGVPVSFVGQVKVKVAGKVSSGDYILADGSSVGYAKSKSEVSFEEFRDKVVGMAWESKEREGVGKVLVAVGVK